MSEATQAERETPSLEEMIEEGNGSGVQVFIHGVEEATVFRYLQAGYTTKVERRERELTAWDDPSKGKVYYTCDVSLPWGKATLFTDGGEKE